MNLNRESAQLYLQSKLQDFGFTIDYQPAYIIMGIVAFFHFSGQTEGNVMIDP